MPETAVDRLEGEEMEADGPLASFHVVDFMVAPLVPVAVPVRVAEAVPDVVDVVVLAVTWIPLIMAATDCPETVLTKMLT